MTSWLDYDKTYRLQTPHMAYDTPICPFAASHPISGSAHLATSGVVGDESGPIATPSSSFDGTPTQGRFTNAPGDDRIESTFGVLDGSDVRLNDFAEEKLKPTLIRHVNKEEGYEIG